VRIAKVSFPHSEIDGLRSAIRFKKGGPQFVTIARTENINPRNRSDRRNIFGRLMGGPKMAVNKTRPITKEYDGQIVVSDVYLDLFKDPNGNERTQPINERAKTLPGKPRSNANHVLFRDTGVDVLIRKFTSELIE
jgi:hypothetical protein